MILLFFSSFTLFTEFTAFWLSFSSIWFVLLVFRFTYYLLLGGVNKNE